jgi:hypothetical protein
MVSSSAREAIVAKVMGLVEGFFASMRAWEGNEALYVAEHSALRTALAIARVLLEGWLDSLRGGQHGPRDVDETGCVRGFKQYVVRTIETVVGTVRVVLAQYYGKGAEPACVYPLARRLGLGSGQYSRGLEELVAMAGAHGAYRESLVWLERLTGARVSVHKAETTTLAWGQEAKAKRLATSGRPETRTERIAATRPVEGLRVCIATDGTQVPTTERWREVKLIASYPFDDEGQRAGPTTYAGTLHYQADYEALLWQVMEATQASRAETLVWLGDGAPWIWNQQALHAPHAVAIVDFYHAADRLWKLGRALHGEGRAAKGWSKRWVSKLYVGKVRALTRALTRLVQQRGDPPEDCPDDDPRKLLADALGYFTRNAERMQYDAYTAKGYPIGSGVVESACRHVVGLRMKRTAATTWHEENAEAMVQLRCLRATGDWDRFWGTDKLWQHIRAVAA